MEPFIEKIISGGQTGVDQAALDYALNQKIPCGGFCPKDRLCENGTIPMEYPLTETSKPNYDHRTMKNVLASDGTLILTFDLKMGPGARLTLDFCKRNNKPALLIDLNRSLINNVHKLQWWMDQHPIKTLNVAGNRESKAQGIYDATLNFLNQLPLYATSVD